MKPSLTLLPALGDRAGRAAPTASAQAAISMSLLTQNGTNTDATSYNTASVSPTANRLLILVVAGASTGWPGPNSVTGNGLTWTKAGNQTIILDAEGISIWYAYTGSTPSAGAISIGFPVTQSYCIWAVHEVSGSRLAGAPFGNFGATTNIVTTTSPSVPFIFGSSPTDAASAIFSAVLIRQNAAFTPGTGMTELADQGVTHPRRMQTQYKSAPPPNSTFASFTGTPDYYAMMLFEVSAGAA